MKILDAHQHFWKFDPIRDAWISDEMKVIQRDFLPDDFDENTKNLGVVGSIAVQADQSETETQFLLDLSNKNNRILGVVGWVDLQNENCNERLDYWREAKHIVGFRHIVQAESDPNFMQRAAFERGISYLEKYDFTYDILIFPAQLPSAIELVRRFPNQRFVLDHLAKPFIKSGVIENWAKDIVALAQYENVSCKVSGMVTEADWKHWKYTDFIPYLEIILENFGTKRILYGSDWPVCLVASDYESVLSVAKDFFKKLTITEQAAIFYDNAYDFYQIRKAN